MIICLNLQFAMTALLKVCEGLIDNNGYQPRDQKPV